MEKLSIDVHAKVGSDWQDLGLSREVPLNILNFHESQATESMESEVTPPLS